MRNHSWCSLVVLMGADSVLAHPQRLVNTELIGPSISVVRLGDSNSPLIAIKNVDIHQSIRLYVSHSGTHMF